MVPDHVWSQGGECPHGWRRGKFKRKSGSSKEESQDNQKASRKCGDKSRTLTGFCLHDDVKIWWMHVYEKVVEGF